VDTNYILMLLNQDKYQPLLEEILTQPQLSNSLLNLIFTPRSDERLIQQMLLNQQILNPETLIQLSNTLSDTHRMALLQVLTSRITTETSSLTTTQITQFIGASQQQNVQRPMPNSGLNAEKLTDKDIETPSEYCCPLSFSIMTDPVYLLNDPTGTRFERDWITRWLIDNGTHPTTRDAYLPSALRSDIDLKARIDEFVQSTEAITTNSLSK